MSTGLLALPFGVAIGLLLGLVGGGGSVLALPVLVYVLGQPVREATTESLLVVGTAALVGSIDHARAGRVHTRTALAFGAAGSFGAVAGTMLNRMVSAHVLMLAFALLLLGAAAMMMRRRPDPNSAQRNVPLSRAAAVGIGTGVLTGFLGVGGGFVIVPALVLLLGLPLTLAVGTSLLVIALNSAAALTAHLSTGTLDWQVAFTFAVGAVAGTLAGRRAANKVEPARLGQLLACVLAVVALFVLGEVLVAG